MAWEPHDARDPQASLRFLTRPWRTGRKVGRNIYAQLGDAPGDDDVYIGNMDTALLAREAVFRHNDAHGFA